MKGTRLLVAVLVGLALLPAAAWSRGGREGAARGPLRTRLARPAQADVTDLTQYLDINRIAMIVSNTGSFAYDFGNNGPGLEFPQGSGSFACYAAGIWVGGKVGSEVRLAVVDYSSEWSPGIILPNGLPDDFTRDEYVVYRLDRADTTGLGLYNYGAVPYGAPAVTVNTDGTLNILGDEMLWSVFNDAEATNHINQAGQTAPLGIEVQQTLFAFNRQGALGQTAFVKYRMINKSSNTIDSMYVSQWADPDLGFYLDDLVGCDVNLSLGYVYNADNNDEGVYGSTPPSLGFDFFKGPIGYSGAELGMTSFNKYINGTDPDNFNKTYNFMKGLNPDGTALVNPTTNQVTTYFVSGDPVSAAGWLDTNPSDRRLMLSSGPFQMAPGDTQEVVVGLVIGEGSNRLASITQLRCGDAEAQSAFDQDFILAPTPTSPIVTAQARPSSVLLTWDNSSENYQGGVYNWEGYVIYQGAAATGPFKRVATYDLNDGITTVLEPTCDEESGQILPQVRVLGKDSGIRYEIVITSDLFRGGPLRLGTPYYFTVNSYAVGIGQVPQVLESPNNVITVVPQTPPAGVDFTAAGIDSGPYQGQITPGGLTTTDVIQVTVVNPDQVLDARYRVGYEVGPGGVIVWYLERTSGNPPVTVRLIDNWTNYSGDENYPIVDGLQVKVVGCDLGALCSVRYTNTGANPQTFVGYGDALGLGFFDGSADYADVLADVLGVDGGLSSADTSLFDNVEIRFTDGSPGQKAYRYLRCAPCSPRTYLFQDYVDVPFTVWDIDRNRQLNAGFLENNAGTPNGQWDPDDNPDPFVDRQFLLVFGSTYSATPDPFYDTDLLDNGGSLDQMYVFWPLRATVGGNPVPTDDGDKVSFLLATRSVNDYFYFTTRAANRFSASVAKAELSQVRAVPNPYFTRSRYEADQFNRVLKFTHLPERCTIRIFTLAGDLVRTLQKNDTTSLLEWDLETENQIPVGSGVYIFHVDAPGAGTTTGKFIVFMEKERLNNF